MSLDPGPLFLSIVFGLIGSALLLYGKKQQRIPQMIAGLLFIVFPYFTETTTSMSLVGLAIGAGLWWSLRAGW
jgi:hypothetical protein